MLTTAPSITRLTAVHGPLCFGEERRSQPRVGFDCPVRWGTEGEARIGWAQDASENGAGFTIRTTTPPSVGDEVELVFKLDNYCEWLVDHRAVVQWCELAGNGAYRVGVKLATFSCASRVRN